MKQLITVGIVIFIFISCVSEKKFADDVIKTRMPKVPWMLPAKDSAVLVDRWRNGIIVYKASCSGCHGVFNKAKDSIPDFSVVDMHNYQVAFLAGDKKNHAVMKKLTQDEMDNVFRFISDLRK